MKMPMTMIISMLVRAPSALPTAVVSRPTEPSSCAPIEAVPPSGIRPRLAGKRHQPVELAH